jgi:hypothetical protein
MTLNMEPPSSLQKSHKLGRWLVTLQRERNRPQRIGVVSQGLGKRKEDGVHMGQWEIKGLKRAVTP